ncbi:hypothetical protein Taro_038201 [Colocasia esculenta]|uniref:Uncharacterized protein n=1 Tax=Colocasia esculenta TaxID=4460 RepID=A0A843WLI3_COLES|nr:hypothetical protein [Colocasia esculenta]
MGELQGGLKALKASSNFRFQVIPKISQRRDGMSAKETCLHLELLNVESLGSADPGSDRRLGIRLWGEVPRNPSF